MELSVYSSDLFKNRIFPSFLLKLKGAASAGNYADSVNMLCDYLKCDFLDITKDGAQKFFSGLYSGETSKSGKKLSVASVKIHHARIRSLSAYIQTEQETFGIEYDSPFLFLNIAEPAGYLSEKDIMTSSEIDRLLSSARDLQMYLMVSLALTCGLTVKELISLKPNQLVLDEQNRLSISFLKENGHEYRYVKVPEELKEPLLLHADSGRAYSDTVFYNKKGTPYSKRLLDMHIKKLMDDAGLSGWTMRDLRNTASFYMLAGGANHSQVATQLNISQRWMYRFNKVVEEMDVQASDYNMIQVRRRRPE